MWKTDQSECRMERRYGGAAGGVKVVARERCHVIFKMAARTGAILLAIATVTLCASILPKGSGDNAQVVVGYYAESLCPDCINLSIGPMNKAFLQACALIRV